MGIQSDDIRAVLETTWIIGQDAAAPRVREPGKDSVIIVLFNNGFLQALKCVFLFAILHSQVNSEQTNE